MSNDHADSNDFPDSQEVGGAKLKKKFEKLSLTDLTQLTEPQQKKQRMDQTLPPKHNCQEGSPEFIDPAHSDEKCAACNNIAVGPYVAPCGHIFGAVLYRIFELQSTDSFLCPGENGDCNTVIKLSEMHSDKALFKAIQRKTIKCSNADKGCKHTMVYRKLKLHLAQECQHEPVKCPSCTELFERRLLSKHQKNCRSKICPFAEFGCTNVQPSTLNAASTSSSSSIKEHSNGLHLGFLLQTLARILGIAQFSYKNVELAITKQRRERTGEDEALTMISHPDYTRTEAMNITELRTNYVNKKMDAKSHLESYNQVIHAEFPKQVAEPSFRMRNRSQYLERQEEDRNEDMKQQLENINELPILLNYGSIIFKVTKFSDKRTQAIKGELKRGVYGPRFYTHEFGYLMVPILYPNGDGSGAGTHLSIFIAIKKGQYDSLLRWPLVGRVTISILSQRRVGREAVRHSFRTDVASLSYHRPINDMNQASGIPKALDLNLLKQPSDYLVDDTLFIQIQTEPHIPER